MSFVNTLNLNNVDYTNLNTHCQRIDSSNTDISYLFSNEMQSKIETLDISNNIKVLLKQYHALKKQPSSYQNDMMLNKLSKQIYEEQNKSGLIQFNKIDYWNNPFVYGDAHFWDKSFDYNNKTDGSGKHLQFKGVCNTMLLDSCNNVKKSDENEMLGVCIPDQFDDNNNKYHINTSPNKHYMIFEESDIINNYKLSSNSIIPDGVDPKNFSSKYCQNSDFLEINNIFVCK